MISQGVYTIFQMHLELGKAGVFPTDINAYTTVGNDH